MNSPVVPPVRSLIASFFTFILAFTSRSWWTPQRGHVHSRKARCFTSLVWSPQCEQSWLLANVLLTAITSLPYHYCFVCKHCAKLWPTHFANGFCEFVMFQLFGNLTKKAIHPSPMHGDILGSCVEVEVFSLKSWPIVDSTILLWKCGILDIYDAIYTTTD